MDNNSGNLPQTTVTDICQDIFAGIDRLLNSFNGVVNDPNNTFSHNGGYRSNQSLSETTQNTATDMN